MHPNRVAQGGQNGGINLSCLLRFVDAVFGIAGRLSVGNHSGVSTKGRNVGIVFRPFWAAVAVLNWVSFPAFYR